MAGRIINGSAVPKVATMQDIAASVGVSQATVSYVLNAKPNARIRPETRRRILEAAARLNYRPNAIARAMASGRSSTVGVYQPHAGESPLSGMWTASVLRGISEGLHERQFHLLLYGYRSSEEPPPEAFADGRVDGLLILAPHLDDALPLRLAQRRFPLAIIGGRGFEGPCTVSVGADNAAGGRQAVEHLFQHGHTRIAHLAGPENVPDAADRQAGYEAALRALGLPVRAEYIARCDFDEAGGEQATHRVLAVSPRPTALFVANDVAAVGALRACAGLGLRVPEEVALVGYDDAPVCALTTPALTSIRQPSTTMGRAAAEMLLEMLDGGTPAQTRRVFPTELIARESSGGPLP